VTDTPHVTGQTGQTGPTGPLRAPCTYCYQPAGQPCRRSRSRWVGDLDRSPVRKPHAARVRLAAAGWTVRYRDGDAVAEPLRVVNGHSVEIRCPHCARTHWHGWTPEMADDYSHRAGHCAGTDGYLIAPTGTVDAQ